MRDKLISTITFCKRLGKLALGFDAVKSAMQLDEAALVLTASDLSPKTKKEIQYLSEVFAVPIRGVELTLDELWYLIGKRAGVIAVCDEGFAEKLIRLTDSSIDKNI